MSAGTNAINWFEIPAADINRAKAFYETVFGITLDPPVEMMGVRMSFFPATQGNGKVSGALVQGQMHNPSTDGAVLYLNANPEIHGVLERIERAGGKIIMSRTLISPEVGYRGKQLADKLALLFSK